MNRRKWQTLCDTVQTTFHMLFVIFSIIVLVDALSDGVISFRYVNLDYALVSVLSFGAILIPLELMSKRGR